MHPWMIEQVAREQRRELLSRAARPRVRRGWTWRSLASYIGMARTIRGPARTRPSLAPLQGGASRRRPTPAGLSNQLATGAPVAPGPGDQASAA